MELPTTAKVQSCDCDGGVDISVGRVENTTVCRQTSVCHCIRLCVVIAACVIVTSLELVLICVLGVSSIQRGIDVDRLQQQVADLQQTVAILQHQQQQQQSDELVQLDTSKHQHELHTTALSEVSE